MGADTFVIQIWEDDKDRGVIVDDKDQYRQNIIGATGAVISVLALSVAKGALSNPANWVVLGDLVASYMAGLVYELTIGDDVVGQVVVASEWNARTGDNVTHTHAVVLSGRRVGQVDVNYRPRCYWAAFCP